MRKKRINRRFRQAVTHRQKQLVSDRRWAKKVMGHQGEDRFLALMDACPQGILIHSHEGAPLFVNKRYANMLGYCPDELLSLEHIHTLYPANERYRRQGDWQARLPAHGQSAPPKVQQMAVYCKDGSQIIVQHSVSFIQWQGLPAVLIAAVDITEQHIARQALALSEERFRDFAESASDWCWEMDKSLRFTYVSDSFERITGASKSSILGLTRKELIGQHINYLHISAEERRSWERHWDVLARREPFSNFEYTWRRAGDTCIVISASGKPIFDQHHQFCGYRGSASNITDERKLSEQLSFQATHDELTGLINRRHFDSELHKAIDEAHIKQVEHVLVFMDLDRFKIVNDTCGHMAGDKLLKQLAAIFQKVFSKRDLLGRLGGDEFAVIMRNCTVDQSMRIINNLHDQVNRFRFVWEGQSFTVGVSIGVASINNHTESVSRLLQNVDSACYMAKETGRSKTHVFSENDEDLSKRQGEMHWAARITQALEKRDFTLYAQPILPLGEGSGIFYELLIRMKDQGEIIPPRMFLPAAERYDLSMNIDKWVLRTALDWIRKNTYILNKVRFVFINLSAKTIGKKAFGDYVLKMLGNYGVPPEKICFEITETTAIANLAEAVSFIKRLKAAGCFFALDDFGSGVSSFAYLKNLPVDFLKIDGMFIRDMRVNEVNMAMVKSINEISHVMGKQTIAEFVEDNATIEILKNIGVDYVQGYAVAHPVALGELDDSSKIIKPPIP